jgi:ketosteroid isomerase-like protein
MSRESVESMRQALDAVNRGDRAACLALWDPALLNVPPRDWPESDPIQGREAVWDFFVEANEQWEDSVYEFGELIDAGKDKVVALVRGEMRGKASGAGVPWSFWQVVTFRDGRAVRFEWFAERADALEAAGLSEIAMSRENVDVVRGIYDAVARRDAIAPFEVYAEDIVWDLSKARRAALNPKPVYHGHEGVRQAWRDALSAFGEVDFEVEELIDAGDQVLAVIHEREVGRASGVPVETSHLAVWTLADAKVIRMQVFDDRQQALEAVGLRE